MKSNLNNKVTLTGFVGKDVQLTTFETGKKKASLTIATSESYKNPAGDYVTTTQWHNVVAWGKSGEQLSTHIAKGDKIMIEGSIQYRSYKDKAGMDRYITEIILISFQKLIKNFEANEGLPV